MKSLMKYTAWCMILLCTLSSCKDEIPEEINDGYKIDTELSIDGVYVPKTKAENSMGWTTGDGIYHAGEQANVAAYAKSGYELVRFYAKDGDSEYQGKSSYRVSVVKDQTFKAEFRSAQAKQVMVRPRIYGTLSETSNGYGSVSGGGYYVQGTSVKLTATPHSGSYQLLGWYQGGRLYSTNKEITVTAGSSDTWYDAQFGSVSSQVTVTTYIYGTTVSYQNGCSVSSSPLGYVNPGTTVTLNADYSRVNYAFEGWYDQNYNRIATNEWTTVTANSNATYYGKFRKL